MWQDYIISFFSFILMIGIVPQISYNFKHKICEIPYITSVPTSISLLAIGITFITIPAFFCNNNSFNIIDMVYHSVSEDLL